MAWNFHITRRQRSAERDGLIDLTEWADVVGADASMTLEPSAHHGLSRSGLTAAVWYGHSKGHLVRFEWIAGTISAVRPDEETLDKLRLLAYTLRGHVEDDQGGWYDSRGQFLGHLAVS